MLRVDEIEADNEEEEEDRKTLFRDACFIPRGNDSKKKERKRWPREEEKEKSFSDGVGFTNNKIK